MNTKLEQLQAIKNSELQKELNEKTAELEIKTRALEIEAALEQVRSRTMAMHNSEDVASATATMIDELKKLGIDNLRCGIANIHPDRTFDVFGVTNLADGNKMSGIDSFGIDEHPIWQRWFESWKNKDEVFIAYVAGQEKEEYFNNINSHRNYLPQKIAHFPDSFFQAYFFEQGFVWAYSLIQHSEPEKEIMKRFATGFLFTFRRYQDLKKAEAQAREAQIEASLERVRAKAMAMHSSKDIETATAVVFNELTRLGINMERCGICFMKETPNAENWYTAPVSPENKEIVRVITGQLDLSFHPMGQQFHKHWGEGKVSTSYKLVGNDVHDYYDKLENQQEYQFPKITSYPDQQFGNMFFFKQGGIFAFTNDELSAEAKNILPRFAKVFEQTYTRFLDIQKAEAQTREAQIEAALERVRSKAMAMHNSEDLNATFGSFYRELEQFSITPRRCGVGLLQKNRVAELSTMNTTEQGTSIEIVGILKMEGHWLLDGVYDNWCMQKEYHPILRGSEIKEYNQIIRPQIAFPEYPESSVQYGYFFFFPEGGVYAWTEKEMKEDELNIYRKFTSVLSLTYKRYKDLKDAESNAREAVRRASLDRVRAEIASMRTVNDLQRITPIIWQELTILGVPFLRCGVFIINEETEHIQVYLSAPDGHSLAALNLSFNSSKLAIDTVDHWHRDLVFKTHWNKQEFIDWMKSMIELGQVSNQETYQGAAQPPESLHLNFVPFKQGMLYVGNNSPLEKDELELVKTLADSFSIAYARYEDFRQLEKAKNQIEKTFTELKAAQAQLIQSEKMASLGELTAGIAHEIQNPLNFVNNFSEISEELVAELKDELINGSYENAKDLSGDIIQNLQKIKHHGQRASDIVKGMLQHSRTSNGVKEPMDINALADEYLRLAFHGLRAKDKSFHAEFKTDLDPTLPKINIIPQDIGRVLLNLINNAFYAVHTVETQHAASLQNTLRKPDYKPTVTVSTKNMKTHVEIQIKDNGRGIPTEIKEKIFQPFFTTKPTGQGTGLGLSLSYDIVKAHGGEILLTSIQGKGSEFQIILPAI
jgi:signal transduction histidine kinase